LFQQWFGTLVCAQSRQAGRLMIQVRNTGQVHRASAARAGSNRVGDKVVESTLGRHGKGRSKVWFDHGMDTESAGNIVGAAIDANCRLDLG
jgi:hypothetical protein